jgi:bacillopeptidase F (M6 metalloprotease family)
MLGDTTGSLMGSLSLDVSTDGGQTWTLDEWTLTGTQGANWLEAVVDLNAYAGQSVTLRFRGVTDSYRSDMAIDDIVVTGTP